MKIPRAASFVIAPLQKFRSQTWAETIPKLPNPAALLHTRQNPFVPTAFLSSYLDLCQGGLGGAERERKQREVLRK